MDYVDSLIKVFGAGTISFLVCFILTPFFTNFLYKNKLGKQIREVGLTGGSLFSELHQKKSGTPTMGGLLIWGVVSLLSAPLLLNLDWASDTRGFLVLPLFTLFTCGILGAVDDYFNIRGIGKHKGIGAKPKLFWLTLFAGLGAWWFYHKLGIHSIHVPGIGDYDLGLWYIPLFIFIIIATANAVNITDGLDGLAGGLLIIAFSAFGVISYVKGVLILSIFCGLITGALLAFLWFNIPPARFFMGDTGSLSLGATLGVIALLTDSVLVLPLIGFIFVIETLSCIIQITSKKLRNGKKVFIIAPVHHHFEKKGWPEYKVTMRFWVIGALMATIGLIIGLIGMGTNPLPI